MAIEFKALTHPRQATPLVLTALLALLYGPLLWHWVDGWITKSISIEHEYFSYGLIGLPFAAYVAWLKRSRWQALPDTSQPWGLSLLVLAAIAYGTGLTEWVNLSFPLALAGLCWTWKGLPGLRLMAFPLLFVLLATPNEVPYLISPHTLWLQHFIASVAGFILNQFDLGVTVEGIYLYVNDRIVEVAPYCAGLKMLLTSLYVGLMLLYWTGAIRSRLKVVLLLGGAIAISVFMNILRNTGLTFFHGTGRDGLFSMFHEGIGGDLYSAGMLGLIMLWLYGLEQILPPETNSELL